jgi:hypothetical protein
MTLTCETGGINRVPERRTVFIFEHYNKSSSGEKVMDDSALYQLRCFGSLRAIVRGWNFMRRPDAMRHRGLCC